MHDARHKWHAVIKIAGEGIATAIDIDHGAAEEAILREDGYKLGGQAGCLFGSDT